MSLRSSLAYSNGLGGYDTDLIVITKTSFSHQVQFLGLNDSDMVKLYKKSLSSLESLGNILDTKEAALWWNTLFNSPFDKEDLNLLFAQLNQKIKNKTPVNDLSQISIQNDIVLFLFILTLEVQMSTRLKLKKDQRKALYLFLEDTDLMSFLANINQFSQGLILLQDAIFTDSLFNSKNSQFSFWQFFYAMELTGIKLLNNDSNTQILSSGTSKLYQISLKDQHVLSFSSWGGYFADLNKNYANSQSIQELSQFFKSVLGIETAGLVIIRLNLFLKYYFELHQVSSKREPFYEGSFMFNQILKEVNKSPAIFEEFYEAPKDIQVKSNLIQKKGMYTAIPFYQYDMNSMYSYINSTSFEETGLNSELNSPLSNKWAWNKPILVENLSVKKLLHECQEGSQGFHWVTLTYKNWIKINNTLGLNIKFPILTLTKDIDYIDYNIISPMQVNRVEQITTIVTSNFLKSMASLDLPFVVSKSILFEINEHLHSDSDFVLELKESYNLAKERDILYDYIKIMYTRYYGKMSLDYKDNHNLETSIPNSALSGYKYSQWLGEHDIDTALNKLGIVHEGHDQEGKFRLTQEMKLFYYFMVFEIHDFTISPNKYQSFNPSSLSSLSVSHHPSQSSLSLSHRLPIPMLFYYSKGDQDFIFNLEKFIKSYNILPDKSIFNRDPQLLDYSLMLDQFYLQYSSIPYFNLEDWFPSSSSNLIVDSFNGFKKPVMIENTSLSKTLFEFKPISNINDPFNWFKYFMKEHQLDLNQLLDEPTSLQLLHPLETLTEQSLSPVKVSSPTIMKGIHPLSDPDYPINTNNSLHLVESLGLYHSKTENTEGSFNVLSNQKSQVNFYTQLISQCFPSRRQIQVIPHKNEIEIYSQANYPKLVNAQITVTGRLLLNLLILKLKDEHNINVYRKATDSVITDKELPQNWVSKKSGDFKLEHTFRYYFYFTFNVYFGVTTENKLVYNFVNLPSGETILFSYLGDSKRYQSYINLNLKQFLMEKSPSVIGRLFCLKSNFEHIYFFTAAEAEKGDLSKEYHPHHQRSLLNLILPEKKFFDYNPQGKYLLNKNTDRMNTNTDDKDKLIQYLSQGDYQGFKNGKNDIKKTKVIGGFSNIKLDVDYVYMMLHKEFEMSLQDVKWYGYIGNSIDYFKEGHLYYESERAKKSNRRLYTIYRNSFHLDHNIAKSFIGLFMDFTEILNEYKRLKAIYNITDCNMVENYNMVEQKTPYHFYKNVIKDIIKKAGFSITNSNWSTFHFQEKSPTSRGPSSDLDLDIISSHFILYQIILLESDLRIINDHYIQEGTHPSNKVYLRLHQRKMRYLKDLKQFKEFGYH